MLQAQCHRNCILQEPDERRNQEKSFSSVFLQHPLLTSLTLCQMLIENGEIFKEIILSVAEQAMTGRFGTVRQYIENWHRGSLDCLVDSF